VTSGEGSLISVDGVNAGALKNAARAIVAANRRRRPGVSLWGASGIFDELVFAEENAGVPSARTLLLLYAADLVFRLRWEIQPALDEGRLVVAAPYVTTAIAFGQAAGIDAAWLTDLFHFAPQPAERRWVDAPPAKQLADRAGFVEFAWHRLEKRMRGLTRVQMMDRTRRHLRATARRTAGNGT
jgi:thymidylate kinase